MSPTGRRSSQGHRAGYGAERIEGSMHREVSMHESRPEQQQIKLFGTEWYQLYDIYTYLSTTAVSPFLFCFTMSWWWVQLEAGSIGLNCLERAP